MDQSPNHKDLFRGQGSFTKVDTARPLSGGCSSRAELIDKLSWRAPRCSIAMCEALSEAASGGDVGEIRFLLAAGVSVNTPFRNGMLPLNAALMSGHEDVAKALIDAGASVDSEDSFRVDESCRHPVHYAASANCLDCLRLILSSGVDVNTCDFWDATPLHHAAANGHLTVTKYLVQSGSDVNHVNKSGHSAVWKAAQAGHVEVVKYLYKSGADINIQNKLYATVLFDLVKEGSLVIAKFLLQQGLRVDTLDLVGNSALHLAASVGQTDSVRLLLQHGADVDVLNDHGNTALHSAAKHGRIHTVVELLNSRASYTLFNSARQSALYLAMLSKHAHTVSLMRAAGAHLSPREHTMYQQYEVSRYPGKREFYDWVCEFFNTPLPLVAICRITIRNSLLPTPKMATDKLPLPTPTKRYLLLQDYLELQLTSDKLS